MWVKTIHDSPELVRPVIEAMRADDRHEIFACRNSDCDDALERDVLSLGPISWVAGNDSGPIALFGCETMWPGVFSMWLFATDNFPQIRFSMTKLVKRDIVPMMFDAGAHRLEARSIEGHTTAQRWLERLGAAREATLVGYGRNREDFHIYTWEAPQCVCH